MSDAPETREWLIDGFNVLHASLFSDGDRSEWWTAPRRERLVGLARHFSDPAARIWIVFDGPRPSAPDDDADAQERVQVVFADSADDWIVKRVRSSEEPGRLAVVTGDRQVADRARHRGARVAAPRDFIARCATPDGPA
ncbi:MAG: NYN domain-containing protein [Deltaproteobacteria bacterium]|nr:NYN domain-containing protein [Deltaproteobacteria bacterium]